MCWLGRYTFQILKALMLNWEVLGHIANIEGTFAVVGETVHSFVGRVTHMRIHTNDHCLPRRYMGRAGGDTH